MTSLTACGTTIGVQKNKYVCGSEEVPDNLAEEAFENVEDIKKLLAGRKLGDDITSGALQEALNTYDRETTRLKEIYEEQVEKRGRNYPVLRPATCVQGGQFDEGGWVPASFILGFAADGFVGAAVFCC